ncbi:MAG: cytidine deaminase [Bacteroidia bacterium]|nr:cytidine deaminase [Bacteroidia bacterium]MDW8301081.1 cytidine deaminase [Bacteroidia bacterium]
MKTIKLNCSYTIIEEWNELQQDEQELIVAAKKASKLAYAPYSEFFVGAAILLKDGKTILTGNNQENAAYPSGLCAERVAYFQAGALGYAKEIAKIAITAYTQKFEYSNPVSPCGACRQVMAEYEQLSKQPTIILLTGSNLLPVYRIEGVEMLLPLQFKLY